MNWWKSWWRPAPPAWARFFSKGEYYRFLEEIRGYFRRRGLAIVIEDSILCVPAGLPGGIQRCGLLNLAQRCKQEADAATWPGIIAAHFDSFERHLQESARVQEIARDFERVAPLLAVRLYPQEYLEGDTARHCVFRRDLPGTVTVLVYDLPSSIQNVRPGDVASWGRDVEEIFEIALDNVRLHSIPQRSEVACGDGIALQVLTGQDYFVATHALLLDEHPACVGIHGALVGVPHRHAVLTYPIRDMAVLRVVQPMLGAIIGMERDGPGSISSQLFWYHDGSYERLPYRVDRQRLIVEPPAPFLELLQTLARTDEDESLGG
jgi:hypothetical protein